MVDFLTPFLISHIKAFMKPIVRNTLDKLLHPFEWNLWLMIFLVVNIFAIVKFLSVKISNDTDKDLFQLKNR